MEKCLIVAIADNLAIGKDNALLWHIAEDMKFLRTTTTGSPVIMGRKTYESIGRPLPKRLNIVISRSMEAPEGVIVVDSLEKAFAAAEESGAEKCFVMGGGQIYRQSMELVDKLYVTHVHTTIDGADTFFPEIDHEKWEVFWSSETKNDPETGYDFEFKIWQAR
ncbi:MAG: dihydrofolate reductase [Bacteroidales bacterium]|nr:dihydrofolate reductase [Candidatus Cryptobacteroides choladohippi]